MPIPFATMAAILIIDKQLCYSLAALFGYKELRNLPGILADVHKAKEVRIAFLITAIADLFLFEPSTSAISGATAVTYIVIIGMAFSSTFEELAKKELSGMDKEEIEKTLMSVFRKYFKLYKDIKIYKKDDLDKAKNIYFRK